jgi:hypothetical protein
MSKPIWYWNRLKAMSPAEMAGRAYKKLYQFQDEKFDTERFGVDASELTVRRNYPSLPPKTQAPAELVEALKQDVEAIRRGEWMAFGDLPIHVDLPPRWHKDYLAGVDLSEPRSAFDLNHRSLPQGADIKLIWELSRWYSLSRLSQAAYLLADGKAAELVLSLLEDWHSKNPPYRGWNWTSALESGMRLVQFAWIDALLAESGVLAGDLQRRLEKLRVNLLLPHVWYTSRYRSIGSSANNHLLGELCGLLVAAGRWPRLSRWSASVSSLHRTFEEEILKQFAPDGGNKEQALNYQLFSWEFAWHSRKALEALGRSNSEAVNDRLKRAADFFVAVQVPDEPWDYGDSDNAFVTPLLLNQRDAVREWCSWMSHHSSPALQYWFGDFPYSNMPATALATGENEECSVMHFEESGILIVRKDRWRLRWDLSPLGYLSTGAHGHLDALHLTLWRNNQAIIVDPGTGAYYGDPSLREYLASWDAHNAPVPDGLDFPNRSGPFLWEKHHEKPELISSSEQMWAARLTLPGHVLERTITWDEPSKGWRIADKSLSRSGNVCGFRVNWQFAPQTRIAPKGPRTFELQRQSTRLILHVDERWDEIRIVDQVGPNQEGLCSPGFRRTQFAPCLILRSAGSTTPLTTELRFCT